MKGDSEFDINFDDDEGHDSSVDDFIKSVIAVALVFAVVTVLALLAPRA